MNITTDIISIRPEKETDTREIYRLNMLAFQQENEARLVDTLRAAKTFIPGLSLVAIMNEQIVGYILFSKIVIVDIAGNRHASLALAPMAVHPAYQKKGIGGQLIAKGLEEANQLGFQSVIVLGHEEYYPQFGFIPTARWHIKPPFPVPDNAFMAMEIFPGSLDNISGTVEYPDEFSTFNLQQ